MSSEKNNDRTEEVRPDYRHVYPVLLLPAAPKTFGKFGYYAHKPRAGSLDGG